MLKMYHDRQHTGDSPDLWEENWRTGQFEQGVRFCAIDPLRPLFERYLKPGGLMLEGGCGMGTYVTYYSSRGFKVVGLDFAQKALKTLKKRQPHLALCGGDVSKLPFADGTFDLYYSGGVVEHFEGGADESLREARRVLKGDGTILISVPYFSPLRRLQAPFRKDEWRIVPRSVVEDVELGEGRKFFQYAYRPAEFQTMLTAAGLKTIEKQGYAVLWGLSEVPFLNRNGRSEFPAQAAQQPTAATAKPDIVDMVKDRPGSLLQRLAVREDSSIPVLGLGVKLMRWSVANMMMYVCVRN